VLAVLVIFLFHSARPFDGGAWHVKNADHSLVLQVFVQFIDQWAMPLFLLLAGMSTWLALDVRSAGQYVLERTRRLLVPLAFGCLAIIPPQVYVERISPWAAGRQSPINFNGSFFEFYPHFFEGVYPHGNFSWHHLWFIAYLFVYSLVALPLVLALKRTRRGREGLARFAAVLVSGRRLLLLAIPIAAVEVALRERFPGTHALHNDWANHAHFLLVFFYGCLLIGDARLSEALARNRTLALSLGSVLTAGLFVAMYRIPSASPVVMGTGRALWHAGEWCWLIALLGLAHAFLNRPFASLRRAAPVAYPFYILHQTVIVLVAYYVVRWDVGAAPKYMAVAAPALMITAALCEALRRTRLTRFLFGMPRA
jgi:glucan biosynthesis protein C